jgi:hypothetical protein
MNPQSFTILTNMTITATFTSIGTVAVPTFDPIGGTYTTAQSVTISCATDGAQIYFTADGSTPTAGSGIPYSVPISVNATKILKAIAVKSGYLDSAVATASYTITVSPWAKAYVGGAIDEFYAVIPTPDGGLFAAGDTESYGAGVKDGWALKLSSSGDVEWQKALGGTSWDWVNAAAVTSDGDYILAGDTRSFGIGVEDHWVVRLSPDGSVVWDKTFGGSDIDNVYGVSATSDGGCIVAGYKDFNGGAVMGSVWVTRLSTTGSVDWSKTYDGSAADFGWSVRSTSDGGCIVAAQTYSFGAGAYADAWVLKLSSAGAVEWGEKFGGSTGHEYAYAACQASDGGYIVSGFTESVGAGGQDGWLTKLSATGEVEWQKALGGSGNDYLRALAATPDGGCIAVGDTASFGAGGYDAWVVKLSSTGTVEWQKRFGGSSNDYGYGVSTIPGGGYAVAGATSSFGSGGQNAWVIVLGPDGSCGSFGVDTAATVTITSFAATATSAAVTDAAPTLVDRAATVTTTTATVTQVAP